MIPQLFLQAFDYAEIVAKKESITLFDAFSRASARFSLPVSELARLYEQRQLELKLLAQAARVEKYQNISK